LEAHTAKLKFNIEHSERNGDSMAAAALSSSFSGLNVLLALVKSPQNTNKLFCFFAPFFAFISFYK